MVQRFKPGDVRGDQRPKAGQDGRNGRNESKKIIKKSASFKLCGVGGDIQGIEAVKKPKAIDLSDVNDLISLPHMANYVQEPRKPPPQSKVPNYMKPTRSSGAKKDSKQASVSTVVKCTTGDKNQARNNLSPKSEPSGRCLVKTSSLKLARNLTKSLSSKQTGSVKKSISDTHAQKATCSSLLKDSKFPSYVMVEAGGSESRGASSIEVCSYKYCSLNGHRHGTVQPLKSFLSDRRCSLKNKNQKCLKLEDATQEVPFSKENETKECEDFFIDIYENVDIENNTLTTGIEAESDGELYESIWEAYEKEIQEFEFTEVQLEEEVCIKIENEAESDCISESFFEGLVNVSEDNVKISVESKNNDNLQCLNSNDTDEKFSYMEDLVDKKMVYAKDENIAVCMEDKENAEDDKMENKCETDRESVELDQNIFAYITSDGESELGHSGIRSTKCKRAEDLDSEKGFNPQEPNYLPLEPKQKAEQVDLKHQDIDERKNSEEWMVDYALQKTVTKLAPVKRKKVELLVEAFESVAPVTKRENSARASFPFTSIRTIQACN